MKQEERVSGAQEALESFLAKPGEYAKALAATVDSYPVLELFYNGSWRVIPRYRIPRDFDESESVLLGLPPMPPDWWQDGFEDAGGTALEAAWVYEDDLDFHEELHQLLLAAMTSDYGNYWG